MLVTAVQVVTLQPRAEANLAEVAVRSTGRCADGRRVEVVVAVALVITRHDREAPASQHSPQMGYFVLGISFWQCERVHRPTASTLGPQQQHTGWGDLSCLCELVHRHRCAICPSTSKATVDPIVQESGGTSFALLTP